MKIVIAPDSFKGTASAVQVCAYLADGIRQILPNAQLVLVPIADGGEGTVEAFMHAANGTLYKRTVCGPLGAPVDAAWCMLKDQTAVVEMAQASGLTQIDAAQLNPLVTTTRGTGELIKAALDAVCKKMVIGIGGSSTNDGGAGMAQALGARFLDERGNTLPPGGAALMRLHTIDLVDLDQRVLACSITVASDVTNPLCGPNGASCVYGPQKGATLDMVTQLDAALSHYADICAREIGRDVRDIPGAGAAGGLGAGLLAFCGARLVSGIETVLNAVAFERLIADADLVITGEGRIDAQSVNGKVPVGVALRTKALKNIPVIAVVGCMGEGAQLTYSQGIDEILPLADTHTSRKYAMEHTASLLQMMGRTLAARYAQS